MAQAHDLGRRKRDAAMLLVADRKPKRRARRHTSPYQDWCRTPGHPTDCTVSGCPR